MNYFELQCTFVLSKSVVANDVHCSDDITLVMNYSFEYFHICFFGSVWMSDCILQHVCTYVICIVLNCMYSMCENINL